MRVADGIPERVSYFRETVSNRTGGGGGKEGPYYSGQGEGEVLEQVISTRKLFIQKCEEKLAKAIPKGSENEEFVDVENIKIFTEELEAPPSDDGPLEAQIPGGEEPEERERPSVQNSDRDRRRRRRRYNRIMSEEEESDSQSDIQPSTTTSKIGSPPGTSRQTNRRPWPWEVSRTRNRPSPLTTARSNKNVTPTNKRRRKGLFGANFEVDDFIGSINSAVQLQTRKLTATTPKANFVVSDDDDDCESDEDWKPPVVNSSEEVEALEAEEDADSESEGDASSSGSSSSSGDTQTQNRKRRRSNNKNDKKSRKLLTCDKCGKGFRTSSNLKFHSMTHRPPRSFQFWCIFCEKSFRKRSHLDRHIQRHIHEKPNICSICRSEHRDLKYHLQRVHTVPSDLSMDTVVMDPETPVKTKTHSSKKTLSEGSTPRLPTGRRLKTPSESEYYYYQCDICHKEKGRGRRPRYKDLEEARLHLQLDHKLSPEEIQQSEQTRLITKRMVTKLGDSQEEIEDGMLLVDPSEITPSKRIEDFKIISCPVSTCRARFLHPTAYLNHSKYHGTFKCHLCDVSKDEAVQLALHEILDHYEQGSSTTTSERKLYNCKRCEWGSNSKPDYLRHHLGLHLQLPLVTGICPICEFPSSGTDEHCGVSFFETRSHMSHCHDVGELPPEHISTCPLCPAYFKTGRQLDSHKKISHHHAAGCSTEAINNELECGDCKRIFKSGLHLRQHRYNVHLKEEDLKWACSAGDNCQRRFETFADLENHRRLVHNPTNSRVPCPVCGETFWRTTLTLHMRAHRAKDPSTTAADGGDHPQQPKVVCDQCGATFKHKDSLKEHLLRHSGPASWSYSCEFCGRKCISAASLRLHLRTHSGAKEYVCEVCGKAYAHRHRLQHHVKNKHSSDEVVAVVKEVEGGH